jgi:hypothetical protein
MTTEHTTDCGAVYIIAYYWQMVLNLEYCTPRKWYTFIDTCSNYVFIIHMYLIMIIWLMQRIQNFDLKNARNRQIWNDYKNCLAWLGCMEARATACVTSYLEVCLFYICHRPVVRLQKVLLSCYMACSFTSPLSDHRLSGLPNFLFPRVFIVLFI